MSCALRKFFSEIVCSVDFTRNFYSLSNRVEANNNSKMSDLLGQLVEANVFKVGKFTLKSGAISPIYIDLRGIIALPRLVGELARAVRDTGVRGDVVCGVPYTALPVASVYSHLFDTPMVMKRKEVKEHGTKKMVEGVPAEKGRSCLVLEDIVTSGSSVIETVAVLREEGLVVTDCLVILDRQQGGRENLEKASIRLHSLFTVTDFFRRYCTVRAVSPELVECVERYLKDNTYIPPIKALKVCRLPFEQRSLAAGQSVAKKLFSVIAAKQSNLCVAVDVQSSEELLRLADILGPHICILKTHVDVLQDFDSSVLPARLRALADCHNFLVLEDRKFADIGNTAMQQYTSGLYRIQEWADIVTVHGLPGPGILEALGQCSSGVKQDRACVLVAEMSSKGALTDSAYCANTVKMALDHPDFVIGFVAQNAVPNAPDMVVMCPGVSISSSGDCLGQQYRSPEEAVASGADVIIVGRGICGATDVVQTAIQYKTRCYSAYCSATEAD